MIQILESMEANNVQLVDNIEFLNWAQVTPNPNTFPGDFHRSIPRHKELPFTVKTAFLTEHGASPFESVEELKDALLVLFGYRADRLLEVIALPGYSPVPDLSSCSYETLAVGSHV